MLKPEELIIDITQIKESAEWHPKCCIYKVPKRLRDVKKEAYTPKLISIGPVHRDNDELKDMQTLKLRYFKEFFSRTCKGQKEFASIVEKNEDMIRNCYAADISLPEGEDFKKMFLLDSIFIIELFLRTFSTRKDESGIRIIQKDYILSKPWLKDGIRQDLILLENQVPFFLLNDLYDQSLCTGIHKSFLTLACNYFFLSDKELSIDKDEELTIENEVKHFTDLHRYFYHPPNHGTGDPIDHLYSATKLDMAGLIFQKWEPQKLEEKSFEEKRCLLDIKIRKWEHMEICPCINCSWLMLCLPCLEKFSCLERMQTRLVVPQFVVDDGTEDLFRNLMALEQCHYPSEAYICNYILLLDFLINSKEDVELLDDERIFVNSLGSNEAVANMVNKLGHEIVETNSYYHAVAKDLNGHYKNCWNHNMASLKTVYFRNIWRGTATVVGVIVLLITFLNFLRPFVLKNI